MFGFTCYNANGAKGCCQQLDHNAVMLGALTGQAGAPERGEMER